MHGIAPNVELQAEIQRDKEVEFDDTTQRREDMDTAPRHSEAVDNPVRVVAAAALH